MSDKETQRGAAPSSNPRIIAWRCLQRWEQGGVFAETLIEREASHLHPRNRALVQALVLSVLRNLSLLDFYCSCLRSGKLEPAVRWLLRLGLCQLFVLQKPDHAAVGETVALAPARLRGLVNGVLRNAVRRREELLKSVAQQTMGVRYSTPDWLVERWCADFGAEETEAMLAWNTQIPPVYCRINPQNPPQVPEAWVPHSQLEGWYRLPGGLPREDLQAGRVYVADPSTRYSVQLLAPRPGERVLDACAAPGGKSAAMLAATGGRLRLLATDAEAHRLHQLRENLQRAGGAEAEVQQHDWTRPCPEPWRGAFDAVLLDVPCSNSGVLQRRVDARWRLRAEEITRLAGIQRSILECACEALRPGGRLVYSTCSVDREENRDVVEAFLAAHPEFSLVSDYLALPHREQADGAYAALLRKSDIF